MLIVVDKVVDVISKALSFRGFIFQSVLAAPTSGGTLTLGRRLRATWWRDIECTTTSSICARDAV